MNKTKKALFLFAKSSVEAGRAHPEDLAALISAAGLEVSWAYLDDLLYSLDMTKGVGLYDSRNQREIQDYSVVYFRYWAVQEGHAIAAARMCKMLGVPFIDDEIIRAGTRNKLSQYTCLLEAGIAIPKSLMGAPEVLCEYYERYGFTFPFIMKDKGGARGEGNYLVHDGAEMRAVTAKHPGVTFIIQEFIPNDGDYRVFVVGGKAELLIYRTGANGSHLNNISQGGSAKIVPMSDLPAEVVAQSERAAVTFGRDVAGVDLVLSKADGKYYCFEVNRAPQIEHASFEQEKAQILRNYLLSF